MPPAQIVEALTIGSVAGLGVLAAIADSQQADPRSGPVDAPYSRNRGALPRHCAVGTIDPGEQLAAQIALRTFTEAAQRLGLQVVAHAGTTLLVERPAAGHAKAVRLTVVLGHHPNPEKRRRLYWWLKDPESNGDSPVLWECAPATEAHAAADKLRSLLALLAEERR